MFFNMHFRNNSAGYTGTVNQMLSKFILLLRIHGSILPYILFTIVQLWRTCFVSLLWVLRYECFIFECKCGRVWLCCLCLCSNVFLPQSIASLLPFFFEKKKQLSLAAARCLPGCDRFSNLNSRNINISSRTE